MVRSIKENRSVQMVTPPLPRIHSMPASLRVVAFMHIEAA
jgi:hypothetical protein